MTAPRNYRAAQIAAIRAAKKAARDLAIEDVSWVDAFDAVIRAGAFLVFQPLKSLFGVYLPQFPGGGAPGVMINVNHPLNLQRYTAAHELGHLRMGHATSLDTAQEILGTAEARSFVRRSLTEIAAEVFAAHLLMPVSRVLPRMSALGLAQRDLRSPRNVYSLSLWFGVSYRAMVRQLIAIKQLQPSAAAALLSTQPKTIKQAVLGEGALDDWHADVWPLTTRESGEVVHARVGDELSITLPNHSAGGYLWEPGGADQEAFDVLAIDDVVDGAAHHASEYVGSSPVRRARIRIKEPGQHGLSMAERRPWQPDSPAAAEFRMTVVGMVQPQTGAAEQLRRRLISG